MNRLHSNLGFGLGGTAICLIICIGVIDRTPVSSLILTLVLLALGLAVLCTEARKGLLPSEVLITFFITFSARLIFTSISHLALSIFFSDSVPLWHWAPDGGDGVVFWALSEHWLQALQEKRFFAEQPYPFESDYSTWTVLIGIMRFFCGQLDGASFFSAKLLNCFSSSLVVSQIYLLTTSTFDRKVAYISFMLGLALPDYFLLGSTCQRDAWTSMIVAMIFHQIAFLSLEKRFILWRLIVILILNFFVIPHLKVWLSLLIVTTAVSCIIWQIFTNKAKILVFILILIPILMTLTSKSATQKLVNTILYLGDSLDLISRVKMSAVIAVESAKEGSLGTEFAKKSIILRLPVNTMQLMLHIPSWSSFQTYGVVPRSIMEFISGIVWYGYVVFLPTGFLNTLYRYQHKKTVWVWLPALVFTFALAISGTMIIRWRLLVMPFLLPMIACGIIAQKHRQLIFLSSIGIIGLYIIYFFLKYL